MNEVAQIITSAANFGFAAVMCFLQFNFISTTEKKQNDQINVMTEALNNNTKAIERLEERIIRSE